MGRCSSSSQPQEVSRCVGKLFTRGNNVEIIALKRLREAYGNLLESSNEVAKKFLDYEIQPDQ